jgi:AraC-like DNA-binding protein
MTQVSLERWLSALMDRRHRLTIDERYFGESIRTDGWSCRGRSEPWHFIFLALEGRSVGRSGGEDITIEPGQALWLPPGAVHDFTWTPTFRYDEVWFRLDDFTPVARPVRFDGAAELHPLFERLADEMRVERPYREASLRCLLATMTVALMRLMDSPSTPAAGLSVSQRDRLTRYTQAHIGDNLQPADLARQVDLTPDYFARQFRSSYGCSPRTWLTRERSRAAARLLSGSSLRVFQIAEHLGYADVPQFSRQFKAITGQSPQAFRDTAIAMSAVNRGSATSPSSSAIHAPSADARTGSGERARGRTGRPGGP